jgi:hypothetical protein
MYILSYIILYIYIYIYIYGVAEVGVDLKDRKQLLVGYLRREVEVERERWRSLTRLLVCQALSY